MSITGQYIDGYGKTRFVIIEDAVLLISPTAPLSKIPLFQLRSNKLKDAKRWCKKYNIDIDTIDYDFEQKIIYGFWLNGETVKKRFKGINSPYFYLPIMHMHNESSGDDNDEIDATAPEDTLNFDLDKLKISTNDSELNEIRKGRKIANIYKKYALYLYAHTLTEYEDRIVVKSSIDLSSEIIDSLPKKVDFDNTILTKAKKLYVPTEDIKRRLIDYVSTYTLNYDPKTFANLRLNNYTSLEDFEKHENEFIFDDISLIDKLAMIASSSFADITTTFNPQSAFAYVYKSPMILNGVVVIVQNVDGATYERAATVTERWLSDRKNLGFSATTSKTIDASKIKTIRLGEKVIVSESVCYVLEYAEARFSAILKV